MTRTLDYSSHRERDSLITIMEVVAIALLPCDMVAEIVFGSWHNGLRGAGILAQDVVATAVVCGVPVVGIVVSMGVIWLCRRRRVLGSVLGVVMALMHAWCLYVFGWFEVFFWS